MNAVEMVKEICKERNIPISRLERECGFSNGYISKLKRGYFPIDKAEKIANTEKKITRLKELYLNELITLDDYKHDLAAYKADIDTFKAEARKYKGTDKKALYDLVGRNLADWYWTLNDDERKTIWRSVIDTIYCDGDKNIRVVFR